MHKRWYFYRNWNKLCLYDCLHCTQALVRIAHTFSGCYYTNKRHRPENFSLKQDTTMFFLLFRPSPQLQRIISIASAYEWAKRIIISSKSRIILFLLILARDRKLQILAAAIVSLVVFEPHASPKAGKYLFWLLCCPLYTCSLYCNSKLDSFCDVLEDSSIDKWMWPGKELGIEIVIKIMIVD